jgi:hypothetical protein
VPSYGNKTTRNLHLARAHYIATVSIGTSTAVAQTQNTVMDKDGVSLPGFGHPAAAKNPTDVPLQGGLVSFPLDRATPATGTPGGRPKLRRVK